MSARRPTMGDAGRWLTGLWICFTAHGSASADQALPYFDPLHVSPAQVGLPGDVTSCARGAPLPERLLTLEAALAFALCHQPQLQASWAGIQVQAAALGEAKAAWWPTVNATISQQRTTTSYPALTAANTSTQGYTEYLSLSWRLLDFGGRAANQRAAGLTLEAALASHYATALKLSASVVQGYFDLTAARAVASARELAVEAARQTERATQRRQDKGVASKGDTLQAQVALAKAELASQRARGDVAQARAELAYAMGRPDQMAFDLPELDEGTPIVVAELERWLQFASEHHPAIMAAEAQLQSARAKVDAALSEGMPTLDLTGSFNGNGYPNQGIQSTSMRAVTTGITLSVPLFEGFAHSYKRNGAEAQAVQSEAQLADTRLQVASDISKAHAVAVSTQANLPAAARLEQASEAALASCRHRYDAGEADVLEVLSAQAALVEARMERAQAVSEWHSARFRLAMAAGVLSVNAVQP